MRNSMNNMVSLTNKLQGKMRWEGIQMKRDVRSVANAMFGPCLDPILNKSAVKIFYEVTEEM